MLFPISQLLEDKEELLCVTRSTKVRDALALMIKYDYSQLPITDANGYLKGIITEQSILGTYFHTNEKVSLLDLSVDHCQTQAETISPEGDIFDALEKLRRIYAIVVVEDKKPKGILTDYDTTNFFRDISEWLIHVQDVELSLRGYIEFLFPDDQSRKAALMRAFDADKRDPTQPARKYEKLSFGNYLQLMTEERNWKKFEQYFQPRDLFLHLMSNVGQVRNRLAHFRGRLEPMQLNALLHAKDWLAARPKPDSPFASQEQTVHVSHENKVAKISSYEGKYAPLRSWLRKQIGRGTAIRISFEDIEALLEESLPPSAREHRSWWGNDYSSHIQSRAWLDSGWLVDKVDFDNAAVVFRPSRTALYPQFFYDLLQRLRKARPAATQAKSVGLDNWFAFSAGTSGFQFSWVLPRESVFRLELYIDKGGEDANARAFNVLLDQKEEIEAEIGEQLEWHELPNRRACRIFTSTPFQITDPPQRHEAARQWGLDMTLKFMDVFQPRIRSL